MLEDPGARSAAISPDEALRNAERTYALFGSGDPVATRLYLVTTPYGGELADPDDPDSPVIRPTLDRTAMWVVYARAEMLKDDNKPERGFVTGTVVVFVDAASGEPQQAITY